MKTKTVRVDDLNITYDFDSVTLKFSTNELYIVRNGYWITLKQLQTIINTTQMILQTTDFGKNKWG